MSRAPKASFEDAMEGTVDLQAEKLGAHMEAQKDAELVLARVLDGAGVPNKALSEAARIHAKIIEHSKKLLDAYITIGQHLIDLREILGSKGYARFIESREVFPFGKSQAFKMTAVVEELPRFQALLGPSFDVGSLPTLAVCYELTTLKDEELNKALDANLFSPATTQRQVVEFKNRLKGVSGGFLDRKRILDRAYRKRAELQIALRKIEEEIAEIERASRPALAAE